MENLQFMRRMDEEHLKHPARSSTQMVDFSEDQGFHTPWGHPAMTRECVQPGCRGFTETVPSGLLDGHRYSVSTLRKQVLNRLSGTVFKAGCPLFHPCSIVEALRGKDGYLTLTRLVIDT